MPPSYRDTGVENEKERMLHEKMHFSITIAEFIYFAANRDNAVNHILITGIVLNSILTAFDFVNVPNSDIAIF